MSNSNPFASLFQESRETKAEPSTKKSFNQILEDLFGFTLDKDRGTRRQLIYLEEVASSFNRTDLDLQVLQHALFDRLFMCNDENSIMKYAKQNYINSKVQETRVIIYLYKCYTSVIDCNDITNDEKNKMKSLITQNAVTAFIQDEIYVGQNLDSQFLELLKDAGSYYDLFFKDVCDGILHEDEGGEECLKNKLTKLLLLTTIDVEKSNLVTLDYSVFNVFNLFTTEEYLANIFIDAKPIKFQTGSDYAHTPIGALLNISILPKLPNGAYLHFMDPIDQASSTASEGVLWGNTNKLTTHIHSVIMALLHLGEGTRKKMLQWIGLCLKANVDRGKLWNAHTLPELNPSNYTTVCDGFMLNLTNVMLRLCQPFSCILKDKKILKVDPTYCNVANEQLEEKNIHLPDMNSETCLLPKEGTDDNKFVAEKYSFVTECFYLAHKTLHLGFQVTADKLAKLNHEVGRTERAYVDALAQASQDSEIVTSLKRRITDQLQKYLSIKAQLSDPVILDLLFDFVAASSYWLCQISLHTEFNSSSTSYAPLTEIPITFPLPDAVPETLKYIPEFVLENIVGYLVFLRRFNQKIFEQHGFDKMKSILSFIVMYMGSIERIRNPHLRARLAEGLEALLPHHHDDANNLNALGGYQRELLFTQHEHRNEIVTSLLKVFVAIEMTGQSVEFEQKFNYRRPMYLVIDYLWNKEEFRNHFKQLATDAEQNMEAVTPPLFLRFVNLLMNDAVYLLDEALANMAKLREMQTARDGGEWDRLSAQERRQNIQYMNHVGMIATFDNLLGRDTIKTLEKLTSEITIVFTHQTMVDRVAAMLNYFLYNLVGPKKKNFKVKDQKEFSFDPANTVLNICKIYVNLKESESFCLAISQDGRSYSPQLFTLAEDVLIRIGGGSLIGELKEVAERVEKKAKEYQANEEALAEAPEHFLDPIMSTLMTDPVILPSSKQTVDRTTIARHLLSDQTDPFNRAPLSMDQVIPNTELAEEIRKWLDERKK